MSTARTIIEVATGKLAAYQVYTRTKMIPFDFTSAKAKIARLNDLAMVIETTEKMAVVMIMYQEVFTVQIALNKEFDKCLTIIDKHSARLRRLARIQAFWCRFNRTFSF